MRMTIIIMTRNIIQNKDQTAQRVSDNDVKQI